MHFDPCLSACIMRFTVDVDGVRVGDLVIARRHLSLAAAALNNLGLVQLDRNQAQVQYRKAY